MPGGPLPEGLVATNNETVGEEIGNVDRVDLEDVARLWRDYSTSRALLHDNTGERLANFFWRIWSNPAISRAIPGSTVARLFMTISGGGNRVRTTPVPSPRSTSPASRDTTPTPSSPQQVAQPTPGTDVAEVPALTPSSSQATTESTSDAAATPAGFTRPSAQILRSVESVSDSASTSTSSRPPTSPSGTRSPTSPTNTTDRSSSSGNRKRAGYFTTSGARAKTKPSLPRRKNSQSASSTAPEPKRSPRLLARKSPPRSPSLQQVQAGPAHVGAPLIAPPPGLPSIPTTATSFALPSTSWQDAGSPASSQMGSSSTAATSQLPSSWLVDTNFRSRFVEKTRGRSSTNLPGLAKSKSTVRFVDQAPGRRATSGAVDTRMAAPSPNATREAVSTGVQTRPRRDSEAIVDEDDDDDDDDEEEEIISLPRTKSQLSMMIEQERRKSGTHELRPSPLQHEVRKEVRDDTASKPNDNENEEEDDLLMMGRKDGVTKAGTLSSKTRGKQRSSPNNSDEFRYHSPPTPPLY